MRQGDYIYAFWLTALILFSGVAAGAAEPRPIDGFSDHSFLIEEAYNQEQGEVQHTLKAVYRNDFRRRGWSFDFEQEWWLFSEDHQVAFSIPSIQIREEGEKQRGVGDLLIEYRYQLLMSSLFRDYVASVRPRGEPFRSRSMVLCLVGHHPVLSIGGNARRQGLKTTFALLCPRSPGLTPRSLFGYSIVDSLIRGA
jgi:hypothetical protein